MPAPFAGASRFISYKGLRVEIFENCISRNRDASPATYVPASVCLGNPVTTAVWKRENYEIPRAEVSISDEILEAECGKD